MKYTLKKGDFILNNNIYKSGRIDFPDSCKCKYPYKNDGERNEVNRWKVAMTYVPMQSWEDTFGLEYGLKEGTIFPSLRLPFEGGGR